VTAKKKAKPAVKKIGRPSGYSEALADTICSRIAEGESLVAICQSEDMPHRATVFRWLADNTSFCDRYVRAREAQADKLAEEILQIADDGQNDTYQTDDGEATNHDVIARSRLRVDARKWLAAKLAPKKYGEKLSVGGADDLPPIKNAHELSTEALIAIASGKQA
jgi:hypothetical protein